MPDKKHLNIKLKEIDSVLSENYSFNTQLGVLSGVSGLSLFQFYFARFLNNERKSDSALLILSSCVENINNGNVYPTYCAGLSGFGWTTTHLNQEGFIEADDNLFTETDEYVFQTMQSFLKNKNYDFLHGALGCGFYFLKRYKNTLLNELKGRYKIYILEFIDSLSDISETDEDGLKWMSIIDIETQEKGSNLSLSHGMSSIINFLSRLYLIDDFKSSVEDILKGGITYMLRFKGKDKNEVSLFPNYISSRKNTQRNSRVAWCYGDLGIGLSLWKASKALKDEILENESIDILKHASKRRLKENTMVMDAGVCHGSFGNAQIFNYMYRQTKIKEFKSACEFWINDGLDKAFHKDGYAGFKMWTKEGWKNELSVLEGIAGIGLVIISYLSEEDSNWDECLMIS